MSMALLALCWPTAFAHLIVANTMPCETGSDILQADQACAAGDVMLQSKMTAKQDAPLVETASFEWPLYELHIPKTGGNFATTVAHTMCSECIDEKASFIISGAVADNQNLSCCKSRIAHMEWNHHPLCGLDFDELPEPKFKHVSTLFREPAQRLISGFYHGRHDCSLLVQKHAPGCKGENDVSSECQPLAVWPPQSTHLDQYAYCVGRCASRMIAGASCGHGPDAGPQQTCIKSVSEAEHRQALAHIESYGFVGLTDEYDLSVCLWHVRFGGPCVAAEFVNQRKGRVNVNGTRGYDANVISTKARSYLKRDFEVYAKAKARFWQDIERYGVSLELCAKICPDGFSRANTAGHTHQS